tara:strand:- start:890 stop:2029 length:1140 start_codon:yes stop_codon:yes gene_type:complete
MATFSKLVKPSAHHDEKTWAGSSSTTTISGLGFQPDWFHIKKRNGTADHSWTDTVRGLTKNINPNNTDGEDTATLIASVTSDGCTLTGGENEVNASSGGYIGHFFKLAGSTTTNDASATGVGTIDSSYRANTDSGISVVTWTGTGANGTIAHGLGKIPDAIITKDIGQDGYHWESYFHGGNRASQGNSINETDNLQFFNDGGTAGDDHTYWNDTAPTSTVFSVGTKNNVNQSGIAQMALVIANTNGSVRCGQYQGNGNAHGSFIFTGFKPRAVWIKAQSISGESTSWKTSTTMALGPDNAAQSGSGSNHGNAIQHNIKMDDANNGGAEVANQDNIQFFAQGFSPFTTDNKSNGEGYFYVYIAWAKEPSVTTTKLLTTAF